MDAVTQLTRALPLTPGRRPARGSPERRIPRCGSFEEGVVVFASAFRRGSAAALLHGFVPEAQAGAVAHFKVIEALPSAARQARVAAFFGERADAASRLRRLLAEAGPELQDALYRLLPRYQRNLFPTYVAPPVRESSPALRAFALRLMREAKT